MPTIKDEILGVKRKQEDIELDALFSDVSEKMEPLQTKNSNELEKLINEYEKIKNNIEEIERKREECIKKDQEIISKIEKIKKELEGVYEKEREEEVQNEKIETSESELAEEEAYFEVKKIKENIEEKLLGPKQITVKEIIDENVTHEEKVQIQEEFPCEKVEEMIEKEAVNQFNDKSIRVKTKNTLLENVARKVKVACAVLFVSATSFKLNTLLPGIDKMKVYSYNNIKIDNLKPFESIRLYEDEINMRDNISIIMKANEKNNDKYLIIDKQNGKCHRYQGDNLIESFNVCTGENIGDEQTELKSTYRQIISDGGTFHRRPEVPIEDATYVQDGERYLKDGYEAFTKWGEGNMKTGAGIYTISNKGPYLGDKALFLKNERGVQVATSLHKNIHGNSKSSRLSNGCVGFPAEGIRELYRVMKIGEKVYILPDDTISNKYKIVDGELRFLSNQKDVNKTIRPYAPRPIIIRAENPSEPSKVFLMAIAENKEKIMNLYPTISNDVYNEIAKLAYGIIGKESTFGTYGKINGGQIGRVGDVVKTLIGLSANVGIGQTSVGSLENKVKKAFNIKDNTDLFNIQTNAISTMSVLLDNYLYLSSHGLKNEYKKLVILKYNQPEVVKKIITKKLTLNNLGPKSRYYIKKVLEYSELTTIYSGETSENYYASNWDYGN